MAVHSSRSLRGTPSKLPGIPHPNLRPGGAGALSVTGSGAGSCHKVSALRNYRTEQLDSWTKLDHWANADKTFWERRGTGDPEEAVTYRSSQQSEELEFQLLERIHSGGFYELKRLFLSQDPEGRGRVRRDELLIVLTTFLGRFISKSAFLQLLGRLHLDIKPIITFDAFYEHFKPKENNSPPEWLDPMRRKQKVDMKTAHQVHLELKEMANSRYYELLKLFRKDYLNISDFQAVLSKLGIRMTEEEFRKLRKRYVTEDGDTLGIEHLQHHLGAGNRQQREENREMLLSALEKVSESGAPPSKKTNIPAASSTRNLSLSIEKWLKEKFREGVRAMMAEFLLYDPQRTGTVLREDFRKVLERFQLLLSADQLGHFLARCGLDETLLHVDYRLFLQRLQTGGKRGRDHKVLCNPGGRAGARSSASTSSVLEGKLRNFLHADYYSLLDEFRKTDTNQSNTISAQQFRAIIEKRYCIKVTDEEFSHLVKKLPTDRYGGIHYLDFMAKFDDSEGNASLWDGTETVVTERYPKSSHTSGDHGKRARPRSTEQLVTLIRRLVRQNYESLEQRFQEMDDMNTRRLTAPRLYQLLKSCDIHPEISREEVDKIWGTLILNQDQTVDFFHFVRHFGFSVNSSCFPNAKISPPVRGDGDCFIRSLKLNSDTKIIANILQSKVQLTLSDIRALFREMDPLNSGCVSVEEFLDVLQELSPDLTRHQCDAIVSKFREGQNRVSYVKFLQPYQTGGASIRVTAGKALRAEDNTDRSLNTITSKLRQKLSSTELRNLFQACQKLDADGCGFLRLPEFRSVVKLCNVVLDEDDLHRVMPGKIHYSRLVLHHRKKK